MSKGRVEGASSRALTVPAELIPFSEPSFLLPGENLRDFEAIRQMMIDDIRPETNVEWLWTLDLIELSREVLRYRRLKTRILDAHRAAAIEAILQRLDGSGMPPHAAPTVRMKAKRTAAEWRDDPAAAAEIEGRLNRCGYDSVDVSAEVLVQAREPFDVLDRLMHAAQNRRIGLLREISMRREFVQRARRVNNADL